MMCSRFAIPLAAIGLVLCGCAAALVAGAAGAFGTVVYQKSEAYRDYRADLPATWSATLKTMRQQGYPVSADVAPGPTEVEVEINDAKVKALKYGDLSTRVRVRIGTFATEDNRRRAKLLLDGIAQELGEKPPPTP